MYATSELVYDVTYKTKVDTLDKSVSLKQLLNYISKDARTLVIYRKIAFDNLPEYRNSCLERNPGYPALLQAAQMRMRFNERPKAVFPDPPPFTRLESRILIGISLEFDEYNDKGIVIARIQRNPYFWSKVSI